MSNFSKGRCRKKLQRHCTRFYEGCPFGILCPMVRTLQKRNKVYLFKLGFYFAFDSWLPSMTK